MRLSLITAVRNAAATLPAALASVRCQRCAGFELEHLILDGASTDGTLALAEAHARAGAGGGAIRVRSQPDRGFYDALNQGIALATGEVVGILNADDYFPREDVLEQVCAALACPGAPPCLYGDLLYVRAPRPSALERQADGGWWLAGAAPYRQWRSGPFRPARFYQGWMPPHPAVFLRRDLFRTLGGYRLDLGTAADYELLLRFLLKNAVPAQYLPRTLVHMRAGGMSGGGLRRRLAVHRLDRQAWSVNGLRPAPWTLACKIVRKLPQFILPCRGRFSNPGSSI
ncbi:MAG: glycosyltransferase family 2 protein [Lentisphaeria bacterium]